MGLRTQDVAAAAAPEVTPTPPNIHLHTDNINPRKFDVKKIREDFPILSEVVNGHALVWLDNGATTQKPQAVIDRLVTYYSHENSNVHRAVHAHTLASRAVAGYEGARATTAKFLGAPNADDIIFVRGATEAINLVANTWGRQNIGPGDEIVVSHLEHHANIVPWQHLAQEKGATLRVIPVDDRGNLIVSALDHLLSDKTKIVAVTHASNTIGTVVPIKEIIARAHAVGAKALIDGAQTVAHTAVNVTDLDADFFVFSGHKVFAPTGIGAAYIRSSILHDLPPWQGGGHVIADVTFEQTRYRPPPARLEPGTGNIADAIGLGTALDYLQGIGLDQIARHEHELIEHAIEALSAIPGIRLIGPPDDKVAVVSFVVEGQQPKDTGTYLNDFGIAVRAGHHCAQPILRRLGVESTVRASFAFYNTHEEIDVLAGALKCLTAGN